MTNTIHKFDFANYKKYYKFLFSNFGHANFIGCKYLAVVLKEYNDMELVQNCFARVGEMLGTTGAAIEKSCRFYMNIITEEFTIEDLRILFDYPFKPMQTKVTLAEFIPVAKFYIENRMD